MAALGQALRGHAVFDHRAKRLSALQAFEEVREREAEVAALEHALRAEHLEALVVAVRGAPAGVDLREPAFAGGDRHRSSVAVA